MNNANSFGGGPAFPNHRGADDGMSLRDWFAGQCIAEAARQLTDPKEAAAAAYNMADALLAERAKAVGA